MNAIKLEDIKLIYINPLHSYKIILKIQKSIKETIPFTIAMKRIKYLGINLPKEAKDLYTEKYKILMKQIKDDTNRWRNVSCLWTGRINVVKKNILHKVINRFNAIPIRQPMVIFHRTRTYNFTIYMETQKTPNSQCILREKNGTGGIKLPDFRLYYEASHHDRKILA